MIDSRSSGKAAERRVAKDTNGQRMGIMGMDDVRTARISFEVKTRKKLPKSIKQWFEQAKNNAHKNNIPVLVMKEKGTQWKDALVVMEYDKFLNYLIVFYAKEKK